MRFWLPLLFLALALAGGVYYRHHAEGMAAKNQAGKQTPPVPVTTAQVRIQDVPRWLQVVGRGSASESVTLKARVDGQVAAVPFNEGQHVQRGDVLIRLDPADFTARLHQAEASLARAQAQSAKARADVERYLALRQSGFISEERLSEVRAAQQVAEAGVQADMAALELARLQLDYTRIRAPIDGLIGAKLVFPGAGVKTNDTPLAVIHRTRPLHIAFAVPEKHLPQLRAAMQQGRLTARIQAEGGREVEGVVSFLDNAVDTATGTIQLKASVANADEALAAGQYVQVRLVLGEWKSVATVPAEAVQEGPKGSFVFVVRADQGVEQRGVTLAETIAGTAIVAAGLEAGEIVVTGGHLRLTPKSKVQIKTPAAPGSGTR